MDLKKAREIANLNYAEASSVLGIPKETIVKIESEMLPEYMQDIIIREYLRERKDKIGNYAIIICLKKTINNEKPKEILDTIRYNSYSDALNALSLHGTKLSFKGKKPPYNFCEVGIWKCDSSWQPAECLKKTVQEIR